MERVTTIGLDIAKSTFQVHGLDASGEVLLRRRVTRARVVPFFEKVGRCWLEERPAPLRKSLRESCGSSATMSG